MKLAIADPPYLGRSAYYDGSNRPKYATNGPMAQSADAHPDAHLWDDPETHRALVADLDRDYDGWVIAMSRDSLPVYLAASPTARVCVWHNPAAWPPGNRVHATWEPVLLRIPEGRRRQGSAQYVKDVLSAVPPRKRGFIGAKPSAWTHWVLDLLGFQPGDVVDDLFPGSGAVSDAIAERLAS